MTTCGRYNLPAKKEKKKKKREKFKSTRKVVMYRKDIQIEPCRQANESLVGLWRTKRFKCTEW